ncbi:MULTISPECIES: acyl carrier protein [unclassified Streptomyces]|uniref:acyl carrier protein n=1 Tax=unclassified Streptomyces TaxID=2593676 RepID=UPI00278BE43E|nr:MULTISPECIES: acyl carrier protein [unclassified Streptomyces]
MNPAPHPETSEQVLDQMTGLLCERLGLLPEEVTHDARLREDLGMDSLDLVELVSILEENLGAPVDDEDAQRLSTVGEVVAHVVDLRGAAAAAAATAGAGAGAVR